MKSIAAAIEEKIISSLKPEHLQVVDDSHGHSRGLETHFTVVVVSSLFDGKSRVERSRMVMNLLDEERARGLHALSQKTFTPQEWSLVKDQFKLEAPACHGGGHSHSHRKTHEH
jgi:BolA protein